MKVKKTGGQMTGSSGGSGSEIEASLRENERFFEGFIDSMPARIYLNADDRLEWYKLLRKNQQQQVVKKSDGDEEMASENEDDDDDEASEGDEDLVEKHSRFDPIYYKTVSQLYKDLAKVRTPLNRQPMPIQKTQKPTDTTNKSVKIENKSQSKGSTKTKNESKKKKKSKNKQKQANNHEQKFANKSDQDSSDAAKSEQAGSVVKKQQKKPILNTNGQVVFSKFDFSVDKTAANSGKGKDKLKASKLNIAHAKPKDYKTLVKRLQEKKEKFEKLKETEPEKAAALEEKEKWRTALDKAAGVKVKDDVDLLKKSIKRIEKKKDKSRKAWSERVKQVESSKRHTQEKRQKNLETRKKKKQEKKVKRLKKKGRLLPGF